MAVFKNELSKQGVLAAKPKHTVLLVDDEPDNLSVLSAILSEQYQILLARDGQEALDLVARMEHPEQLTLVISDQRMPRLTGIQLCEHLCTLSPDTLRIIVTGYIDVDAIVDSVNRAHIYQFVIKPFDRHDFELTVQRAVEAHEMKREIKDYVLNLENKVEQRTFELQQKNQELQAAYAQLEEFSVTDALTGLHNRRYLQTVIEKDIAIACRHYQQDGAGAVASSAASSVTSDSDLVFFLIDCDHFKCVNDEHGHDVGDRMLCAIADVLRQVFRESDHLVRWGGEEFLVIARFIERQQAAEMAERLRLAMENMELLIPNGERLQRTCSIGFAALPFLSFAPEFVVWQQVVKIADCAMYCAKQSGRNTWVGLSAGPEADATTFNLQNQKEIPKMLARAQLRVEASQPVASLRWI